MNALEILKYKRTLLEERIEHLEGEIKLWKKGIKQTQKDLEDVNETIRILEQ